MRLYKATLGVSDHHGLAAADQRLTGPRNWRPSARARTALAAILVVLLSPGWGCSSGNGQGDGGATSGEGGTGGIVDAGGDTTSADGQPSAEPEAPSTWDAPEQSGDYRILFGYRGRIQGDNTDENELWLMDPDIQSKEQISEFKNQDDSKADLSCNYGCLVSRNLRWALVALGPPDIEGNRDFALGKLNPDLEIQLIKDAIFEDIVDIKFAGDILYFSRLAACIGPSCQYEIYRTELPFQTTQIMIYPVESDLEDSTYKGHFHPSPKGERLVLLNTTIRSVQVHVWYEALGMKQLDFICKFGTQNNCSGTGSEYSDIDPVAISHDARWVVFFTFSDRWQRARVYDTSDPGVVRLVVLGDVPTGSYIEHACDPGVLADWQWQRVIGSAHFSPNNEEVYFMTQTDCPASCPSDSACPQGDICLPKKPRTNLRRIKFSTLTQDSTLTAADVYNVTENPFCDVTKNRMLTGFDISPDGSTFVLTATPHLTQSLQPIGDGDARQRNDREVYRMSIIGSGVEQLSNDLAFLAESPMAVAWPPPEEEPIGSPPDE